MSNFIETLRSIEYFPGQLAEEKIEPEICPAVISYVTLGKPLHAGHIFLMATATLAQRGLGDNEPLILVNNNTGPRVAGALVTLSEMNNLPIEEIARRATLGQISPEIVIEAYRARNETSEDLKSVVALLDSGKYDLFTSVVGSTKGNLLDAGFNVEVINEAAMLVQNQRILRRVNPLWRETGFTFFAEKGLSILEKEGQATATGKCLTSLVGVGKLRTIPGEEPFLVLVDASSDSLDATRVYSSLGIGKAVMLPGAGVSFGGEIASGTGGEALTLSEMVSGFYSRCPEGDIVTALQQLVLTMPGSRTRAEIMCLYDFKDNDSLIEALVLAFSKSQELLARVNDSTKKLETKQSAETTFVENSMASKLLNFLPQRAKSLFRVSNDDVISRMSKFTAVKSNFESVLLEQGYSGDELEQRAEIYRTGQKELVYRDNFFFNTLQGLIRIEEQIISLTPEQFSVIEGMVSFCMRRIGYEK